MAIEGIMKNISTLILLLTLVNGVMAQQSYNPLIGQGSEVVIDRLVENNFYYTHTFDEGQTIYSLARTFKTSVGEIYSMNNLPNNSPISVGQIVKVPFNVEALYTEQSSSIQSSNKFIPVYYLAQPKETLYGIGKTYFEQDIATFAKRNKLNGSSILIGQKLLIGWLPLSEEGEIVRVNTTIAKAENKELSQYGNMTPRRDKFITTIITPEPIKDDKDETSVPTPNEIKEIITLASEEISDTLANQLGESTIEVVEETLTTITRKTRGIGIWERNSKVGSMAFVLHHTAKKGSMIELYNPQLNRRTQAKVLGRIPLGTYPNDVSIIMSKKVADSLGALDTRILVELTFQEDI